MRVYAYIHTSTHQDTEDPRCFAMFFPSSCLEGQGVRQPRRARDSASDWESPSLMACRPHTKPVDEVIEREREGCVSAWRCVHMLHYYMYMYVCMYMRMLHYILCVCVCVCALNKSL
jgi:hypothetical protein